LTVTAGKKKQKKRFKTTKNTVQKHAFTPLNKSKRGGSVAEWLARWTQAQKGLGSNSSRDVVG